MNLRFRFAAEDVSNPDIVRTGYRRVAIVGIDGRHQHLVGLVVLSFLMQGHGGDEARAGSHDVRSVAGRTAFTSLDNAIEWLLADASRPLNPSWD